MFQRIRQHLPNLLLIAALVVIIQACDRSGLRGDPDKAREGWRLIENGALVIDVRSTEEFEAGHLEGALHIPWDDTDALMNAIGAAKDRQVVMYCGSGRRVGLAIKELEAEGYTGLYNATGLDALQATHPDGQDSAQP